MDNKEFIIIGTFYRPPNGNQSDSKKTINEITKLIKFACNVKNNNRICQSVTLIGDLNMPDINWTNN